MLLSLALFFACNGSDKDSQPVDSDPPDSTPPADDSGPTSDDSGPDDTDDTDPPAEQPNLLVISIDTLRRDAVGRYGGYETPHLDALLTRGLVLDDHRSCSNWTFPAMICGLAGSGPVELEFAPVATPTESPEDLPDTLSLLGDLLRDKGYTSQGVVTSPFLSPDFNAQRWDQAIFNIDFTGEEITALLLEQAERLQGEDGPWALHGHYMDPHAPFDPPESYIDLTGTDAVPWDLSTEVGMEGLRESWDGLTEDEKQNALEIIDRLYSADVRYLDDQLGALVAGLEKLGALDNTYVLVFSDHGEQFMEHGGVTHGQDLYAEEARAVAGLSGPGIDVGTTDAKTTHADLVPTLYKLLGWETDLQFTGYPIDEISDDRARTALHLFANGTEQTIDVGDYRLLYRWTGELELYDVAADPNEEHDLADDPKLQDQKAAMWDRLAPQVQALARLYTTATPVWPVPVD